MSHIGQTSGRGKYFLNTNKNKDTNSESYQI